MLSFKEEHMVAYYYTAVRQAQVCWTTMRMRNLSKPKFGHVMKPNLTFFPVYIMNKVSEIGAFLKFIKVLQMTWKLKTHYVCIRVQTHIFCKNIPSDHKIARM